MFRVFRTARRNGFAMALALAGGTALGTTVLAPAATAQAQETNYSEGFIAAYQPVAAMVQGDAPDYAGARGRLDAVFAAIQTPDDRNAAGNLALQVGNQMQDDTLRRRGIDMMLESGKVAPDRLAQFNYYSGQFAYNAEDWAAARAAMQAAIDAGYNDGDNDPGNDPEYIILQTYGPEGNPQAGVSYMLGVAQARAAAGQPIPERWLLRTLQTAYDFDLAQESYDVGMLVLERYPSDTNWSNTLQIYNQLNDHPPAERVDLYRLMLDAGVELQQGQYFNFAEDLDPRIMGNEVIAVLDRGVAAGSIDTSDPYYNEVRSTAQSRGAADRRERAAYVREGESGGASEALGTGDVLYSLGEYSEAARFYRLAAERGGNSDTANLRLGIALSKSGDVAGAQAAFAQVGGSREKLAQLWSAFVAR